MTNKEKQRLVEAAGVLVGSVTTRWILKRNGANNWQSYAVASALTSLAVLNRHVERLVELAEAKA